MKRSLIALALVAMLPLAAQADDNLSYTYVDAGYVNIDGDADETVKDPLVGLKLGGFYGLAGYGPLIMLLMTCATAYFEIGFGYAHGLTDRMDLIAEAAYSNSDVQYFGDIDGYRASIGLRGSFTDNFEGLVKANYLDGSDFDGDFSGTVGAQYKFNQTWGLVGEVEFNDNAETYLVGVRASF